MRGGDSYLAFPAEEATVHGPSTEHDTNLAQEQVDGFDVDSFLLIINHNCR